MLLTPALSCCNRTHSESFPSHFFLFTNCDSLLVKQVYIVHQCIYTELVKYQQNFFPFGAHNTIVITLPSEDYVLNFLLHLFQRETFFVTSCFLTWRTKVFQKWGLLLAKIICFDGSTYLPLWDDPNLYERQQ